MAIGAVVGLISFFGGGTARDSIIIGGVFFVCFLAVYMAAYFIKKKR
ncbi:hypothetical protein ACFO4N_12405 [Camelliibacillus cellulosilyticus]|uniref:Uncharacterized protein n=1 Tax=Camelliibacillus cellulosilyticus TaxID=2174486 RepID=A0ABV9GMQ2_9BACL